MSEKSFNQLEQNLEKIVEELHQVEELGEEATEGLEDTGELIHLIEEQGGSREEIREVIEEEELEVSDETKAVELSEDAILRMKMNLGILFERIGMIGEEQNSVESMMSNMSSAMDDRSLMDKDLREELILNIERAVEVLITEARQENGLLEIEQETAKAIAYMIEESEYGEKLDMIQGREEKQTSGLGKKLENDSLVEIGTRLYNEVYRNNERTLKELRQEAKEAGKLEKGINKLYQEIGRTEQEIEALEEFIEGLKEQAKEEGVESEEFWEKLESLEQKLEKPSEMLERNLEEAEEIKEELEEERNEIME